MLSHRFPIVSHVIAEVLPVASGDTVMRYMVSVHVVIPPERAAEARALVPAEGERIAEHTKQGILEVAYTDAARPPTRVWAVMRADSLEEVQRLIDTYPMRPFFSDLSYTQLWEQ